MNDKLAWRRDGPPDTMRTCVCGPCWPSLLAPNTDAKNDRGGDHLPYK